jgi:hypothetical protein
MVHAGRFLRSAESAAVDLGFRSSDMERAIDVAKLSEVTIFELRGEWRRLHRVPPSAATY